jgi:glycosyltransferase involved in cell wall biosynthesis
MTANHKQLGCVATAPQISVAMATYNGERFIREQLESIARQTISPLEIVITDDGSTDATIQIVEDFSRTVSFPVRVFRNEARLGYSDNFLKAGSLCAGDVIAFCDQDDIWLETKLERCSGCFSDPAVLLVVHSAQTFTQDRARGPDYPRFSRTMVIEQGKCDPFANHPGFAMVIKKDLLRLADHRQRPLRLRSHDHWFWFLAASAGRIATVADCLTLYRQHSTNVFGAPQAHDTVWPEVYRTGSHNYIAMADSELVCSHLLIDTAKEHPLWANRLIESAQRLQYRSRLHRIRSRIYAGESTLLHRAASFGRTFLLGGYLPDQSKTRLGLRSAIKDIFLGVLGASWNILKKSQ